MRDKIHILEIVGNAITGGMESYVRNLVQFLPRERFRVSVIAPFEGPFTVEMRDMGLPVYITPIEDDPPWRSIQMAVEVTRQFGVDLIHAHMPRAHVLAALAGCFTQRPIVATIHGMNLTTHEYGIWRLSGAHLITVCQEGYGQALAMGVPPERVSIIPNGVDTERFCPGLSREAFRQEMGIPVDVPLIGLVGRLDFEKSPNRFIEVATIIAARRPKVHFVLVGDGVMRDQLKSTIDKLGLEDRVKLAGDRHDIWNVYPALDVLMNTSSSEGMPLTLLEGMACGLPVVAGRVGGIREIVEERGNGLLVGQGDINGLVERVEKLLDHPDLMKQMGQRSRQRVVQYFNLRTSLALTTQLFERILQPVTKPQEICSPTLAPQKRTN